MRPLAPDDLVRGQFAGYRDEPGVAKDSDVETFCALRLFIDSWRWAGGAVVPALRQMPGRDGHRGAGRAEAAAAAALRRLGAGEAARRTTCASGSPPTPRSRSPPASSARARSSSATSASSTCSTRSRTRRRPTSGSSATPWPATARSSPARTRSRLPGRWSTPSSRTHHRAHPYKPGSWGPAEADELIAADGRWHNPTPALFFVFKTYGGEGQREKEGSSNCW